MRSTSIGAVQIIGRMIGLLDHYNIPGGLGDPDAVRSLAFMLTRDHVLGFVPNRRPPKKPPHRPHDLAVGFRDFFIYVELERARCEGRFVRQAADELAKRWREEGKCDWGGEALRQRYLLIRRNGTPKGMIMAARKIKKISRAMTKS